MGNVARVGLLVMALLASIAAPESAHADPPPVKPKSLKIAIVCDDGAEAKGDEVDALLTAELSKSGQFTLVDRQAVRKVLAEQKLRALTDTASAIKVGQLVGADLMLMCAPLKGVTPAVLRMRLVETVSGIVLADQMKSLERLSSQPEAIRSLLETQVQKLATPAKERKLIGLIGVRSAESGRMLDSPAFTLDIFLRADLTKSPKVVVLEREQLNRLTDEKALSGLDVKLKGSAMLLDVTLQRAQGADADDKVDVTVKITGGAKPQTLKVRSEKELAVLRKRVAEEILKAVQAPAAAFAEGDSKSEAKEFAERGALLRNHGYAEEAARLGEAAYALDPKPEYAKVAFVSYSRLVGDDKLPKVSRLKWARRALAIEIEYLSQLKQEDDPKDVIKVFSPVSMLMTIVQSDLQKLYPLPANPAAEDQRLMREVVELLLEKQRLFADFSKKHGYPIGNLTESYIWYMPYLVKDGFEYCAWVQQAFEAIRNEQASGARQKLNLSTPYAGMLTTFSNLAALKAFPNGVGNVKADQTRPLTDWLIKQPEMTLRLAGYAALSHAPGAEGDKAAAAGLDLVFRAPEVDEEIVQHLKFHQAMMPIQDAVHRLNKSRLLEGYLRDLFTELEKNDNGGVMLVRGPILLGSAFSLLQVSTTRDKRLELAVQAQRILDARPIPVKYAGNLKKVQETVAFWQEGGGAGKPLRPPPSKTDLVDYDVKEIKIGKPPTAEAVLVWVEIDRSKAAPEFYLVWRGKAQKATKDSAQFDVWVTKMGMAGGASTAVARGSLPGILAQGVGTSMEGLRITSGVATPEGLFLADFGKGIIAVKGGKVALWGEKEGLSTNAVWSLGYSGGKIYAGTSGGLVEVDPRSGKCRTLAASRAMASANPLDGGTMYRVANVVAPPGGKSLWLSVGGDLERSGVWRYDIAENTFTRLISPLKQMPDANGPAICWNGNGMLVTGEWMPSGLYDVTTEKCTTPMTSYKSREDQMNMFLAPDLDALGPIGGTMWSVGGQDIDANTQSQAVNYRANRWQVLVGTHWISNSGAIYLSDGTDRQRTAKPFGTAEALFWNAVEPHGKGFIGMRFEYVPMLRGNLTPGIWVVQPRGTKVEAPAKSAGG